MSVHVSHLFFYTLHQGKAEYFRTDINANTKSKCKREARYV